MLKENIASFLKLSYTSNQIIRICPGLAGKWVRIPTWFVFNVKILSGSWKVLRTYLVVSDYMHSIHNDIFNQLNVFFGDLYLSKMVFHIDMVQFGKYMGGRWILPHQCNPVGKNSIGWGSYILTHTMWFQKRLAVFSNLQLLVPMIGSFKLIETIIYSTSLK